jgi:hypothetical protein
MEMKDFLENLSAECCTDMEFRNTFNVSDIFDDGDALDAKKLYIARFGRIPNWIDLVKIDGKKTGEWLVRNYRGRITDCCYVKRYSKRKGMYFDDVYYFMFDDLLVYIDENRSKTKFLFRKTDHVLVETIANEIRKFVKKERSRKKSEIKLLFASPDGLSTKTMNIASPKFSVEENYNDDFLPVHQTILKRLLKKNDKGLILLHGKPGTGKTSYIRYLIGKTRKPVIFLPPNMAASITDPNLMNVLIYHPNSIFVIEDAENIIIDRNRSGSSSVSALLNLADGLLSDCLNIQMICSFNTDLARVDGALTRKGRLIAKYECSELDTHKAQALSDRLGFSSVIASPMTLAAIYNQNETEFAPTIMRRAVGFNCYSQPEAKYACGFYSSR